MSDKAEIRAALTKAFKAFDTDNSNSISASELKALLTQFCKDTNRPCNPAELDSQVQQFIKHVDANKDGKIELNEFINFFEDLFAKYG